MPSTEFIPDEKGMNGEFNSSLGNSAFVGARKVA